MRFFLKSFITLLYSSLSLGANKKGLRALKYHSIRKEQKDDNLWSLDINSFSDHFSFLVDAKIDLFKIDELINLIPDRGLVITFDDGFKDNFEIAAPILLELGIPFSVFVITDFISQSKKGYVDELTLKEFSKNPLITIGSHSCSHPRLTNLSLSEIKKEVSNSKDYLEGLLGREINAFSYPHGLFNDSIRQEVIEAGYKLGFTSHYDINKKTQDKFTLNTNEIWNTDNLTNFQRKINGDWDWLKYRNL